MLYIVLGLLDYCSLMTLFYNFDRETLREILMLLRNTNNPQVEYIIRTMSKWGKENKILFSRDMP